MTRSLAPANLVIAESELASPLCLEDLNDVLDRCAAPSEQPPRRT